MNSYVGSTEPVNQRQNNPEKGSQFHSKPTRGNGGVNESESHEDGNKARINRRRSILSTGSGEGDGGSEDDDLGSDKKPDKKPKAESPDEKRKSFLERNRQAASKCRQRKKQWLNNLQAQVEYLSQENETLQNQATGLREEIINLKTLLLAHKDCPIAQANGAMGIEGLVPVMTGPPMAAPTHLGMPPMNVPMNMLGMPQVIPGPPPGINQMGVPPHIQGQPMHGVPTNVGVGALKEHNAKQAALRKDNEKLRREAVKSLNDLTDCLSDNLNERVAQVYTNQKELEQSAKKISLQAHKYSKQAKNWLQLIDQFNSALKELGDVQNWAEVIEQDMRDVTKTLELVASSNEANAL
ncbi:GCN5L1-domain-containing protein [Basidiobolus meristosporus CBS 931.73]|uniref:GCN5L1-domain-containing protein n=1 Tax=Basidiobolus meristosporus CBS 931.73 TaxID=1314790 RepID=A0A1Y1XZ52_9FUNG|nr:GCN5L1-domain-containing protein [Basidiobolus meristosporus CBS 931.73]|eukprot:ORX91037.1 GCN5L1-domain-containing protein [Basidiobolus meristosporus CBS 931.73]